MSYRSSLAAVVLLATTTPLAFAQDQPSAGPVTFHIADTIFPCREKTPEDFRKLNPDDKVIVTTVRVAATFEGEEDQVDRIDYWLRMPKSIKIADYMPTTQIGAEDAEVIRGTQSVSNEATVTSLNGGAGVGFRLWAVEANAKVGAERRDETGNQVASNVTVKSLPRRALVLAASTEDAGRTLHFRLKRHSQFTLQGDKDYVLLAKVPKDWTGDEFTLECVACRGGVATVRKRVDVGLYIEGDVAAKRRIEGASERRMEEAAKRRAEEVAKFGVLEGSRPGEERDDNGLKMKFRWCPKGSFQMGSAPGEPKRFANEGPVSVTLSRGFWMGKFEVTQEEWRRVMGTTLAEQLEKSTFKSSGLKGEGPTHPMYYVSYAESEEFCRRFTESERRAGRLPLGWEYRLPTEAQWEYACRAGTTTATAFGDQLSSADANFDGNYPYSGAAKGTYAEQTKPVGGYRPNAWGLHDMHGNVFEWCRDFHAEQLAGGADPLGPSNGSDRVVRGGAWSFAAEYCRAAFRGRSTPTDTGRHLGFRLARVPSGPVE